jgi:hypothetical protein
MHLLFASSNETIKKRHFRIAFLPEQSVASLEPTGRNRVPDNHVETPNHAGARPTGVQTNVAGSTGQRTAQGFEHQSPIQRF